jgi:hypothetical protein
MRHSSGPVEFIPINRRNIPEFTRGMEDGSTEFSFSRFLTPYLSGYKGHSVFMDCDMLVRCDIYELLDYVGFNDVAVVKHDYTPKDSDKFLGNKQHAYPKKNWSSLMVFNNWRQPVKRLTPEVVNTASGKYLHQFEWAQRVGEIPRSYNHLVGEYPEHPGARIIHYTLGTPCFKGYENQEWSKEWFQEMERMLHAD